MAVNQGNEPGFGLDQDQLLAARRHAEAPVQGEWIETDQRKGVSHHLGSRSITCETVKSKIVWVEFVF